MTVIVNKCVTNKNHGCTPKQTTISATKITYNGLKIKMPGTSLHSINQLLNQTLYHTIANYFYQKMNVNLQYLPKETKHCRCNTQIFADIQYAVGLKIYLKLISKPISDA